MNVWKKYRIGELCSTISETYRGTDENVVLINTSDVLEGKILNHEAVPNENLKGQFKKTFLPGDILYSEIRPANKRFAYVNIADTHNYIASTKLMVIRCNELVLPEFLFTILKSQRIIDELQMRAESRSGTFPQITFSGELATLEILLPEIGEQKNIVSVLSNFDKKISVNERVNNNLAA